MKIKAPYKALAIAFGLLTSVGVFAQGPVGNAPVANPDTIVTNVAKGKIVISTLTNNDTDADGDVLHILNVGTPEFGKAELKTVNGIKVVEYTPNNKFKGTDSFSYRINDLANGLGNSASSIVTIKNPFVLGRGDYGSLISGPGGSQDVSGYISVKVSPTGQFSCYFRFAGKAYRFKSAFEIAQNGRFMGEIARGNLPRVTLELNYAIDGDVRQITGAAVVAAERIAFTAPLVPWSKSSPPPSLGIYTVLLPAPNTVATTPQGHGFATMSIGRSGIASCIGRTGDGRGFSSSTFVGVSGTPAPVYGIVNTIGSIFGTLNITGVAPRVANAPITISGNLRWFAAKRPTGRQFPKGFDLTVAARGAAYTRPFVGTAANPSTVPSVLRIGKTADHNSNFTASAGDLSSARTERSTVRNIPTAGTYEFAFDNSRRFAAKLVVSAKSGTFSGSFYDVSKKQRRSFKGIFLQSENKAFGVWKSETKTGRIELTPDPVAAN